MFVFPPLKSDTICYFYLYPHLFLKGSEEVHHIFSLFCFFPTTISLRNSEDGRWLVKEFKPGCLWSHTKTVTTILHWILTLCPLESVRKLIQYKRSKKFNSRYKILFACTLLHIHWNKLSQPLPLVGGSLVASKG